MVRIKKGEYRILGIMSGTSLDGLDLALCVFRYRQRKWSFRIEKAHTVPYAGDMKKALREAHSLQAGKLIQFDHEYGQWIGKQCNDFLRNVTPLPDLIASHGHTVFHQPEKGYTFQAGNGHNIAVETGIPVVYDFRSTDIALGGSGAPLVPAGDELLFSEYDYCLNLGGFSNVSYKANRQRIAFDICPVNITLNYEAEKLGYAFDRDGKLGQKGVIIEELLHRLNSLPFYNIPPPRSLMREWFEKDFLPCLANYSNNVDILRTLYEHIADRIASALNSFRKGKMLVTGGGARNSFLISLIKRNCKHELVLPDPVIIDFKEAMVFGFLGLLRYLGKINCYRSVTGAVRDSSAGILVNINNP